MKVKYKYHDDILIIETKDIHPIDLFENNDHISKHVVNIKHHMLNAFHDCATIRMDVETTKGSKITTKYLIKIKNVNLDYLSDIIFDTIDL